MTDDLRPGFIALHGNRTELLLEAVAAFIERQPLAPLEPEIVLVQSNGMAEWVKMALAHRAGICAATVVQLPARFVWQTYRQVLGPAEVPTRSPLDETPLAWRLMRVLPELLAAPGFEPIAGYLQDDALRRRYPLAVRIADLYDQYQVYRPDWLEAWARGREVLIAAGGAESPLPDDQRWQARLWQRLLDELAPAAEALTRAQLHRRVLAQLAAPRAAPQADAAPASAPGARPPSPSLPRRVVLFGTTHIPLPTLELLAALSRHCQVLLAIPNPCRFHWADIIDGREWLRSERRRLPLRGGRPLDEVGLDAMHLHAHPLLAAWGRQARDFIRQLDAFDDTAQTRQQLELPRIDLFDEADEAPDATWLQQVQNRIRDLVPLAEHDRKPVAETDRSIVFHVAHSRVRELEILHDQLLAMFADPPGGAALQPRDIVVMVPAIDVFAPAIRAIFGQYDRNDPRHIPFDIADLSARTSSPLAGAVQWLLRLPRDRCRLSDLSALLEVPAIAARFGVAPDALPRLEAWMTQAGIRWGLDGAHRAGLGLAACGEQNTVLAGVHRMLMGYAVGAAVSSADLPFAGIEPYPEVGGLDAELAGALARLVERLLAWQREAATAGSPASWVARFRTLLAGLVRPLDEADRQTLAALEAALLAWQEACDQAAFDEPLPLDVAAQAWMDALEPPPLARRFRAGGVTFCTLMPMRAIPFEVVCLLGMNDGDYPRRSPRSDFDLVAHPGQQRPGDRARRDDDRQLMLEALLSARRVLYLSWCGHSVRDNAEQPPSPLLAQLRDYLSAGWSPEAVSARTTFHPLQAFGRGYFEPGSTLFTYASEWRAAHLSGADGNAPEASPAAPASLGEGPDRVAGPDIDRLVAFLRNPSKVFFTQVLGVNFEDAIEALPDDERFTLAGLDEYRVIDDLGAALHTELVARPVSELAGLDLPTRAARHLARVARTGLLPIGAPGEFARARVREQLLPMMLAWRAARLALPHDRARIGLRVQAGALVIEDWLDRLVAAESGDEAPVWLDLSPARAISPRTPARRAAETGAFRLALHHLLRPWVRSLLAAASDQPVGGLLICRDASLRIRPMAAETARSQLAELLQAWVAGRAAPLPVAARTAFAQVTGGNPRDAYEGSAHGGRPVQGEGSEGSLARCWPDFGSLAESGEFDDYSQRLYAPIADWAATRVEVTPHPVAPSDQSDNSDVNDDNAP
jgi:exodeoxyribonuclease V gamma subunit